jgi:transcriptional regulator with XRE-family HTH domain
MKDKLPLINEGIRKRLIKIRKRLDLNQKVFAKTVGIFPSHVSVMEKGLRDPPKILLLGLCTELNVDLNWLVTGVGRMFRTPSERLIDATPPINTDRIELLGKLIKEKDRLTIEKDKRIEFLEKRWNDKMIPILNQTS